jgi:hypothetical protein
MANCLGASLERSYRSMLGRVLTLGAAPLSPDEPRALVDVVHENAPASDSEIDEFLPRRVLACRYTSR